MRFEELVRTWEAVKQTRSRQQKVEHLAACIAALGAEPEPDDDADLDDPRYSFADIVELPRPAEDVSTATDPDEEKS